MSQFFSMFVPLCADKYCRSFEQRAWDREEALPEIMNPSSILRESGFEEPAYFMEKFLEVAQTYESEDSRSLLFVCSRIKNTSLLAGIESSICSSLIRSGEFITLDSKMELHQHRTYGSFLCSVLDEIYRNPSTFEEADYVSMRLYSRVPQPQKALPMPSAKVLPFVISP